ncbi:MAG: 16S rRNA (adenine(1518)-N(6)/adenine(1519)-N(6))-dimethyltransferase RsmA [Spirochaetia bacterium]|nr:16S rRNA (adenine(1518)-N(6)/adenine(1519)-N(6))-dimethyltransferase RsmA [Spirochaetota bacterium]MCX8097382.1 16S rRNA (adenine(1518)-N(6)/adenine(1519)-N(6))-dimethyltransferase RsmA [Spirochaetota bacterium]MDW8112912.1 16S rRNA (adenine(1518)-N(6)/adenine(1519)-N(6))-dimethyltransferase RsmA [Spirochaetia bacterium]
MDIYSRNGLRHILKKYNLFLTSSRGQNYLIDKSIAETISEFVLSNVDYNVKVIEVGSGIGSLTVPLARRFNNVISIEIDRGVFACLNDVIDYYQLGSRVNTVNADFLKIKPSDLVGEGEEAVFVSNLPYSLGGEIIRVVTYEYNIKDLFVMVQKEFFERLIAREGEKNYSFLSVVSQLNYSFIRKVFDVSRNFFFPVPSVDSVFIHLRKKENIVDKRIVDLIKKLFSSRRKNILNSICLSTGLDKHIIVDMINSVELDIKSRVENLNPTAILELVRMIISYTR